MKKPSFHILFLSSCLSLKGIACPPLAFAQSHQNETFSAPVIDQEPTTSILSVPNSNSVPAISTEEQTDKKKYDLATSAFFSGAPKSINSGLIWRIYKSDPITRDISLHEKSTDPTPVFQLNKGDYIIHVSYGLASSSKAITISNGPLVERFVLAAGALRLKSSVGDSPIPNSMVSYSVYSPLPDNSEGKLVVEKITSSEIIRLNEGIYHIVSTYGDANAVMRADLKVESGELTEAIMNHRAATVTLKLVSTPGGEAYAGTDFSILTPGGDTIREVKGAFPSITLAEGEYTLVAKHDKDTYIRQFVVETGLHRDIEILTSQLMQQQNQGQ